MICNEVEIRVRYAETDRMGYVYYGNYATYFEVARVETLRHIGTSYKEMEDSGIMLPVVEYSTKYFKPALYDDLLTIRTTIKNKPSVRIVFEYEVYNDKKELLTTAETMLVFVNSQTGRPCQAPERLLKIMGSYFTTS